MPSSIRASSTGQLAAKGRRPLRRHRDARRGPAPATVRATGRPPHSTASGGSHPLTGDCQRLVQLEDVDVRGAEEAEHRTVGLAGDQGAAVPLTPGRGHHRDLGVGVSRRDVGVEPAPRGCDEVGRRVHAHLVPGVELCARVVHEDLGAGPQVRCSRPPAAVGHQRVVGIGPAVDRCGLRILVVLSRSSSGRSGWSRWQ